MSLPNRHWRLPLFLFGALFLPLCCYTWWLTGWQALGWQVWAGGTGVAVFAMLLPLAVGAPDFLGEAVHYVDLRRFSGTRTQASCQCGWTAAMRRTAAEAERDGEAHLKAARERAARGADTPG
jgi:hypothetical protein